MITPTSLGITLLILACVVASAPDSAANPALIPGAIAAVSRWVFKPAGVKGKPALVYAARPVQLLTAESAAQ